LKWLTAAFSTNIIVCASSHLSQRDWDGDVLCGNGAGMVVKCIGMGWGWEKNHGDGMKFAMSLFTTCISMYIYFLTIWPYHFFDRWGQTADI